MGPYEKMAFDKDKLDRESQMQATKMGIDMAEAKDRNSIARKQNDRT